MSSSRKEEQPESHAHDSASQQSHRFVLLRNVPLQASKEEISSFASRFGSVLAVTSKPGAISSTAVVEFVDADSAAAMVAELGKAPTRFYTNTVYATFATSSDVSKQSKCAKGSCICPPRPTLYIRMKNALSYVSLKNLYETFSQYGTVKKALVFQKKGITLASCRRPPCGGVVRGCLLWHDVLFRGSLF